MMPVDVDVDMELVLVQLYSDILIFYILATILSQH
jgi:hypothetical protein